jgi:hypothetical protein
MEKSKKSVVGDVKALMLYGGVIKMVSKGLSANNVVCSSQE